MTGVCLPNRVCGAPEQGLGVDGGTVDGDRRKPLEESDPGGEKKEPTSGSTWDPDGKDRRQTVAEAGTEPRGWWLGS